MTDRDSQRYRQRIYRLQNDDELTLSETLSGILGVGVDYLDVANAHLKRTYPDMGVHRVVAVAGPEPLAEVGDVHDHETTFCRRTLQQETPLAVAEAPTEGWADDPAYVTHELDCYVGTALSVGGEPYGTVCFVDEAARSPGFTDEELGFVEVVGRVVETELTVQEYTRKLQDRDKLLATLNRVLRHNLRNDLNVIRGHARSLAEEVEAEPSERADVVVRTASDLVDLGEEARELVSLLTDRTPPEPRDVVSMVEAVAVDLRVEGPPGTVDVSAPAEARTLGTVHLRRALYELGDNALRYAGPAPTVTFDVDRDGDDNVTVTVTDDGPGLPQAEREILHGREESQLSHGQGLGLWMVHWAVTDVGGTIAVDDDGSAVTLTLRGIEDEDAAGDWIADLALDEATLW